VKAIFLGDVHHFVDGDEEATTPPSAVNQRRVEPRTDEQELERANAWSLLRDTFEYRDFDDSLVFVE
jgi:hypothetical protein